MTLDKLENKIQIYRACKVLSYGKNIPKIGPVYLEIFD